MLEEALELVLHHPRPGGPHDLHVRHRGDPIDVAHHLDLRRGLAHARLRERVEQERQIATLEQLALVAAREGRGRGEVARVAIEPMKQEELCGCLLGVSRGCVGIAQGRFDPSLQILQVEDLVDGVLRLEVLRDKERRSPFWKRDRAVAATLRHAEQVLEVRLLTKDRLVVGVVPRLLVTTLEQRNAASFSHRCGQLGSVYSM
eukprot:7183036-Prymnesium_polylepis.2